NFYPAYVLAPAWGPLAGTDFTELGKRLLISTVLWGLLGAACLALAVWRLRPAYLSELEAVPPGEPSRLAPPRPQVDDDPVRWRERNVDGLAPLYALRRVPRWLALGLIGAATALSSFVILWTFLQPGRSLRDLGTALLTLNPFWVAELVPGA